MAVSGCVPNMFPGICYSNHPIIHTFQLPAHQAFGLGDRLLHCPIEPEGRHHLQPKRWCQNKILYWFQSQQPSEGRAT